MGKTRRDDASVEQRQHCRDDDPGNPAQPFGAAGIGNLPGQKSAKRAERALGEIENTGGSIEHDKPNTGEDINRAGAEPRYNKRTEGRHHLKLTVLRRHPQSAKWRSFSIFAMPARSGSTAWKQDLRVTKLPSLIDLRNRVVMNRVVLVAGTVIPRAARHVGREVLDIAECFRDRGAIDLRRIEL